jgi:hypothetical protein
MTTYPISGNALDTQPTDSGRTMAEDFRVQDDEDRANLIAYFWQRIIEEQNNVFVYRSQLDVCNERIVRYQKIIKTLEGE